ncbi:MAG: dTDP-4-dehydrorhamnose reductase [Bacteroidales bacterium]|jgi:dTDP-4-dehydrorhamnose reductase|nr:dTDP-4-dehydrorhamnose reductase [Bacteroidales bacterium]
MNILITGGNGQLGNELQTISDSIKGVWWLPLRLPDKYIGLDYPCFFFEDVDMLDITSYSAVEFYCIKRDITAIINVAAYTAVDKAENDADAAYKVNEAGVRTLSQVCIKHNIFLLHLSSDYVFDGAANEPYDENAATNPQSIYGKSKLAGERAMIESGVNGIIMRTSWLYSSFGNNFVKTMLRLGGENKEIKVVNDQIGSPTYAADLADAVLQLLAYSCETNDLLQRRILNAPQNGIQKSDVEIFHYTNSGVCSWSEFASEIMRIAGLPCKIIPVSTEEYNSAVLSPVAPRPKYSVLNTSKIQQILKTDIPSWQDSLKKSLALFNQKVHSSVERTYYY